MDRLQKKFFDIIFPLTLRQPWLKEKHEEICQLLFDDCTNPAEQELVLDLLSRFTYLTDEKYQQALEDIAKRITLEIDCAPDNTMIVATTMNSDPDSAQAVLWRMKRLFQEHAWDKVLMVNRANKILAHFPNRKNVIYVDEFVGSGQSMLGRIRTLKKELAGAGHNDYSIRVRSVAASSVGKKILEDEGIDFYSNTIVPRGISDYYIEQQAEKIALMINVESVLSEEYNGKPMPSLGYGKTESLYSYQNGNTPNNVFPIFWWPYYKNNSNRRTILARYMGDA